MKITKHFLNKEVRLEWLDPCSERVSLAHAKKGKGALARWVERGVIDDITEGVVRLIQSHAYSPGQEEADEGLVGWIPEDLIEDIEVMEPLAETGEK